MTCRTCRGAGRITERGRHYGDRSTTTPCPDCRDDAAIYREHAAMMARAARDRAIADDLMGATQ